MNRDKNNDIIGPYFNTSFEVEIGLHPSQMRKNLYENLKKNLIKNYHNKCFKHYGYIMKIYSITKIQGGLITPENSLAPAIFNVTFQCKICRPLKGISLILEVTKIRKAMIYLINGPIHCLIFEGNDRINKENIFFDETRDKYFGKSTSDDNKLMQINPGTFVKVNCLDVRMDKRRVLIIGSLDKIASKEEIKETNINKEAEDILPYYDYDDYATIELVDEDENANDENDENDDE